MVKLPPPAAWGARSQTIAVSGSTDNTSYSSVVAAKSYKFDPATGNSVTIAVPSTNTRYLRLTFTANTAWPAGQASEVEVYAR